MEDPTPQEVIVLKPLRYSRPDIFGEVVAVPHNLGQWVVSCKTSDKDTFYWNHTLGRWDRGPVSSFHTMNQASAVSTLETQSSMLEAAFRILEMHWRM